MEFPKKEDYPPEVINNPFWTEGCGSAYFESNFVVKSLFRKRIAKVISLIDSSRVYERILDIGTGIGYVLPFLSSIGKSVVGTDIDQHLLDDVNFMLKKKNIRNVNLLKDDIENSDLKGWFDLVLCLSNLEHIDPYKACENIVKIASGKIIFGYPLETKLVKKIVEAEKKIFRKNALQQVQEGIEKGLFKHHISNTKAIDSAIFGNFKVNLVGYVSCFGIKVYQIVEAEKIAI